MARTGNTPETGLPLMRLMAGVLLTIGGIGGVLYFSETLQARQTAFTASLLVISIASTAVMRWHRAAGLRLLVLGTWLWSAIAIFAFSGVGSATVAMFPLPIAFGGWMLGRRWLIALTAASIMVVLAVGIGQHQGWYEPNASSPPLVRMGIHVGILLMTGVIVGVAYDNLRNAQTRAVEFGEQLAVHNIELSRREHEVRELNAGLEQRVAERTVELSSALESLRRTQDELVRAEASATIGALVASVSHELATPLANSGIAAAALGEGTRQFQALLDEGQLRKSDVTRLMQQLSDGSDLISRNLARAEDLLLKFKQVAADQASEQRRRFDLAEMVTEVVGTLRPMLKRRPQSLIVDVPAGIGMDSFPGPLGQIIINLVNNAFMHAFDGRSDGTIRISANASNDRVVLSVEDNGAGMTLDVQNQLFKPFFSTKIGAGGTGLGMTIVEGLVRKTLKGSMHVESTRGIGTRIDIDLPRFPESLTA